MVNLKKLKLFSKELILYIILSILSMAILFGFPYISRLLLISIKDGNNNLFIYSMISLIGLTIICIIVYTINHICYKKLSLFISRRAKIVILNLRENTTYKKYSSKELNNDYIYNASNLVSSYYMSKIDIFINITNIFIGATYMFLISRFSVLITLLPALFIGVTVELLKKRSQKIELSYSDNREFFLSNSSKVFDGYYDLYTFNKKKYIFNMFLNENNKYYKMQKNTLKKSLLNSSFFSFSNILVKSFILFSIIIFTYYKYINSIDIIAIISINTNLLITASKFWINILGIKSNKSLLKKMNTTTEKIIFNNKNIFPIQINDLVAKVRDGFIDYPNITISKKEKYILDGKNGKGKSIFIKIILNLFTLKSGKIIYNNIDFNKIYELQISNKIGYIDSKPFIFEGDVYSNLFISKKEISKIPSKYKFILDEIGNLNCDARKKSFGQKQLIELLRNLQLKKEFLVIDEGLSGISKSISSHISKLLNDIKIGLIYVSHNKNILLEAKKITL